MSRILETIKVAEELRHGQIVIIVARWILVAAGLLMAMWNTPPEGIGHLRLQIVFILAIAGLNFYLHSQLLRGRPTIIPAVYAASAADIAVISILVGTQGGADSNLYVFYFPALLALSVAFPTRITAVFAIVTLVVYGLISAFVGMDSSADAAAVTTRLVLLAGVAFCGNAYWRIERNRREAASGTGEPLTHDLEG